MYSSTKVAANGVGESVWKAEYSNIELSRFKWNVPLNTCIYVLPTKNRPIPRATGSAQARKAERGRKTRTFCVSSCLLSDEAKSTPRLATTTPEITVPPKTSVFYMIYSSQLKPGSFDTQCFFHGRIVKKEHKHKA